MTLSRSGYWMGATRMTVEEGIELKDQLKELIYEPDHFTNDYPNLALWDSHYVFVYGNQKSGFKNGDYFSKDPLIGVGYTKVPGFTMYRVAEGQHPVALIGNWIDPTNVRYKDRGRLYGEVYQIPPIAVRSLDYSMNNNVFFKRYKMPCVIQKTNGKQAEIMAFVYLGNKDFWEKKLDRLTQCDLITANADPKFKYYNYMKKYEEK